MSKKKRNIRRDLLSINEAEVVTAKRFHQSKADEALNQSDEANTNWKKKFLYPSVFVAVFALVVLGAMAKNGWLPSTDPLTGKKTGWFGKQLPNNASSSWNPLANPLPTATPTPPQLSKEYIYAGSKLLAVEDAGATAAPPSDLAIWRASTGYWWVMGQTGSQQVSQAWGTAGDKPVQGDYDGDGKTDFSVFRPSNGTWYFVYSAGGSAQITFGQNGDKPTHADFDGDGRTDAAVFRPDTTANTGTWYITRSSDSGTTTQTFGLSDDVPVPADYDGDGKADIAIWRNSNATFYILRSSNSQIQYQSFGASGDKPVPADYDGDGKADLAVWRTNTWYVLQSVNNQTVQYTWGNTSYDIAVPNDYDGDGKVDVAVWRASESTPGAGDVGKWYIRNSSTESARVEQWGIAGDTPVPAYYRR